MELVAAEIGHERDKPHGEWDNPARGELEACFIWYFVVPSLDNSRLVSASWAPRTERGKAGLDNANTSVFMACEAAKERVPVGEREVVSIWGYFSSKRHVTLRSQRHVWPLLQGRRWLAAPRLATLQQLAFTTLLRWVSVHRIVWCVSSFDGNFSLTLFPLSASMVPWLGFFSSRGKLA